MRTAKADYAIPQGKRPYLLVTILGPAETLRLCNASESGGVLVDDDDGGTSYQYLPGVYDVLDYQEEVDLFALTAITSIRTCKLAIAYPGTDIAAKEGTHYGITGSRVEVALSWPGTQWKQRVILLDGGAVTAAAIGISGTATVLTVENLGPTTSSSYLTTDRDIGADFPTAGFTALDGKLWPIPVGRCYRVPGYKLGETSVGRRGLGIAGCHMAPDVVVGDLSFYEDGTTEALTAPTLANTTDSTGNIAYVHVASGADFDTGTGAYTLDFTDGGIASARDPSRAARGAADVLEWLLATSGVTVDWEAMAPCLALLAGWEVGVYIDSVVDHLTLIRERLLPVLPIMEAVSGKGLYYVYADPTVMPVATTLTYGQELPGRVSDTIEYTDLDEIRNVFPVQYGYDSYAGVHVSGLTLDASTSELCRYSQQLYGPRQAQAVKLDVTWDATTARRHAMLLAQRKALPRRVISYYIDPSFYWLRAPTVVRLVDTEAGIDSLRAVVKSSRPFGAPFSVTLEVFDRAPAGLL